MRLPALKFVFILMIISSSAYAGDVKTVKLTDGSVINAEVISMQHGVYTFKSSSLGKFSVNAKLVQSISSSSVPTSRTGTAKIKLNQLQSRLTANPAAMKLIAGLKNDPDIQAILSDPKIMQAVQNGDYTALANNPKFQRLLNNPKIKQIAGGVTR